MIPGSDEALPIVGLGNARVFASNDLEGAAAVLDAFFEHGGAYIDLSGSSRFTVGKLVAGRGREDQAFLGNYLAGQNLEQLRAEIRKLQSVQGESPLDLSMKRDVADLARRADQFRALKKEGLLRYVGIGRPHKRFYPAIMDLIRDAAVDFIQVNYSMLEPEAADAILPMAQDNDVAVVINRPFINGDFFGIVRDHELPEWAAEFDCQSWGQYFLKFNVSHPAVTCAIPATNDPEHLRDNMGASMGRLPDEAMRSRMVQYFESL